MLVAYTGLCGFFIGVCSITLFFFVGVFPSPRIVWYDQPLWGACITGGIGYLCQSALPPTALFLGAYLLMPAPRGGALHRESYMVSLTSRFLPSWFRKGVFVAFFVMMPLKLRIGLPQAIAELGRIDILTVGISSDRQTGYIDWRSYRTPDLLLFDGYIAIILFLPSVGVVEEVKF